ncbi:MAG: hypothetical protein E6G01_12350 [Actinobacteria bacterium]|nr:MAG: hypothetical protein E6G01_12350 [Actinomycetota bacterium]
MPAHEFTFRTTKGVEIPSGRLTPVPLSRPEPRTEDVDYVGDLVVFRSEGWYEILLEVDWDPENRQGTRFSHTAIPGEQPLHSEAVSAAVLADISEGKQLLRGNTLFGPERTASLALEVWQDSGDVVEVRAAAITARVLAVPWPAASPAPRRRP